MQRCILIFRIGSLGDTLIALPSFRHIRQQEPHSKIVLLTNAPVDGGIKAAPSFQVLQNLGLIDDYIEYRLGEANLISHLALAKTIRAQKISRAIYLMPVRTFSQTVRDRLFFLFAGITSLQGMSHSGGYDRHHVKSIGGRYESEAARLLRRVGGTPSTLRRSDFSLGLSLTELAEANQNLLDHGGSYPYIVISIGTKAPVKDWGQENWETLVKQLSERIPGYSLVFIGSRDERHRCSEMAAASIAQSINLCGTLSPRQSGAILAQAELFIGHDSGPMHLANSVGIPIVAIFSARSLPAIWFPFGGDSSVIYHEVSCAGCGLEICVEQKMRCIRGITVDEVMQRVEFELAARPSRSTTYQRYKRET